MSPVSTSFVIVEPAANKTLSPIFTGAIKLTLLPTNTWFPIIVLLFTFPS